MGFGSGKLNTRYRHGHNQSGTSSTYWRWAAMIQRCTNPKNKQYKNYGGRGITVCEPWKDFCNFLKDMGEAPNNAVLDRKENNDGYSPENCRWTTATISAENRRFARLITWNGKTQCISKWAKELGIKYPTLYSRIYNNFPLNKVFQNNI
jgi:hypothetical protein